MARVAATRKAEHDRQFPHLHLLQKSARVSVGG